MLFLLLPVLPLCGQINRAAGTPEEMISIPPLRMLVDSAQMYSPLINSKDIEITIREMELRAQRFEWTDFIQPFTEYRYGTIDNYVFGSAGNLIDIQDTKAHRFNVGARINLSIFDAINYRSKVKQADKQVELDESRREEIKLLVAQEVIRLWNMLHTYREIMFIKSEHMEMQSINLAEAKLLYQTGEVPIMELARIGEIEAKSREEYYLATKEFKEAIFLLSELVGKKDITTWTKN